MSITSVKVGDRIRFGHDDWGVVRTIFDGGERLEVAVTRLFKDGPREVLREVYLHEVRERRQ